MKRSTKLILGLVAGGIGLASISAAVVANDKFEARKELQIASGGSFGHGKHGGRDKMMARMTKLFEDHDVNKDGAVTQDEVDMVRKRALAKFDTDKNGTLSKAEYQNYWADLMEARVTRGFERLDDDDNGQISTDEFIKPLSGIIKRHDEDNDGAVNKEELEEHMKGKGRKGKRHGKYDRDDDEDKS